MTINFGKYVSLIIEHPRNWFWDWGIARPRVQNWSRLLVDFPLGTFTINGWLLWGKKPYNPESDPGHMDKLGSPEDIELRLAYEEAKNRREQ